MKKLFISQPMQGKSKEEIIAERKVAICQAKEAVGDEVEIIDSYFENAPACNRPLWFLGESLKLLATADIAYLQQVGKAHADARSSTPAQRNTASASLRRRECEGGIRYERH